MTLYRTGDLSVRDVLDRIGAARVFRGGDVVIVRVSVLGVVHDVFEDGAEADCGVDFRFLLFRSIVPERGGGERDGVGSLGMTGGRVSSCGNG